MVNNYSERAQKLHQDAIVFDAHVDTLLRVLDRKIDLGERNETIYVDIPRLREGGVNIQVFVAWVDPKKYPGDAGVQRALDLMGALEQQIAKYPQDLELARSVSEARDIVKRGKIACFLVLESGYIINNDLSNLQMFYEKGARYMTLTWMESHEWADSSTDAEKWHGLSPFGKEVVKEMNRLGMIVDVSHASDNVANQVFELSTKPIIISHSTCRALSDDARNVSDDLLRKLRKNSGVMGINFFSKYLSKEPDSVTVETVLNHIDHVVEIAGIDYVGLGSDFDGARMYPKGLEDCSKYPAITEGLMQRGYKDKEIRKILGENFLRVFKAQEDNFPAK